MIYNNLTQLIGDTPLLELSNIEGLKARFLVKLEGFNPGGSAKDRVALAMIEDAEKRGLLKPGATIIEPTSGNTGVGLAWIGAVKGYNVVLTMPESMSVERRKLLSAYGAAIVLTPADKGMGGAVERAEQLCRETEGAVILGQFDNKANPAIHQRTTGEEIWRDTNGIVDVFVAGVGTGGTVSGVGRALKTHRDDVRVVAVEPETSAVISTGKVGKHGIQGIGAGFIPANYDASVVDEVMTVSTEDAFASMRFLASRYGILVGISSGAAFHVAMQLAVLPEYKGKTIVTLLPDTGERYLSLFDQ